MDWEIRAGHQRGEDYEVILRTARGAGRRLRCGRFPAEDGRGADTPSPWEGGLRPRTSPDGPHYSSFSIASSDRLTNCSSSPGDGAAEDRGPCCGTTLRYTTSLARPSTQTRWTRQATTDRLTRACSRISLRSRPTLNNANTESSSALAPIPVELVRCTSKSISKVPRPSLVDSWRLTCTKSK